MPTDKAVVHVIDDDEAMRESLAFLLSAVGMEVRTYKSALGFLDVAPNVEAGCVITDVRMPEAQRCRSAAALAGAQARHPGDRHYRPRRRSAGGGSDEDRRAGFSREAL